MNAHTAFIAQLKFLTTEIESFQTHQTDSAWDAIDSALICAMTLCDIARDDEDTARFTDWYSTEDYTISTIDVPSLMALSHDGIAPEILAYAELK